MSNESSDQQIKNAGFPLTIEQFVCPTEGCEATVPQSHVMTDYLKGQLAPTRIVTVLCPHCQATHRGTFVLQGGMWQLVDDVKRIDNPKQLRSVRRRLETSLRGSLALSA